jgi:alkanesulfonate monooxygenase SsuD/methylene tetrahydromethanopterin reductase-like flavin-dependent oxidoreductase (luciferase family)
MRHVYVAETEARAQSEITDDLLYLEEVRAGGSLGEGSRSERREHAAELAVALVRDELMIAGGPETVAALLIQAREALGIDLFLANVYASGVETARVHRTLRLLAGEVRERLLS